MCPSGMTESEAGGMPGSSHHQQREEARNSPVLTLTDFWPPGLRIHLLLEATKFVAICYCNPTTENACTSLSHSLPGEGVCRYKNFTLRITFMAPQAPC